MKTIELTENGVTAKLTIRPATAGDSLRREMLASNAFEHPLIDSTEQTLAVVFYPRCLAVTNGTINDTPVRELDTAAFAELPASIFEAWWSAVLELNPRWGFGNKSQTPDQEALNEKKE